MGVGVLPERSYILYLFLFLPRQRGYGCWIGIFNGHDDEDNDGHIVVVVVIVVVDNDDEHDDDVLDDGYH